MIKTLNKKWQSMKELCGSHLISSGMNSVCPRPNGALSGRANCKGRRAVKNSSWGKSVVILNNQRHQRSIVFGYNNKITQINTSIHLMLLSLTLLLKLCM